MDLRKKEKSIAGFTLIEVMLAVLILAGSLVVLLGLQSSIINRNIQDRNRQYAMLAARRILSAVETAEEPPQAQTIEGSPDEIVAEILGVSEDRELSPYEEGLQAEMVIEDWPISMIEESPIARLRLLVYWGPSKADSLEVVYFFPVNEEGELDSGDEEEEEEF